MRFGKGTVCTAMVGQRRLNESCKCTGTAQKAVKRYDATPPKGMPPSGGGYGHVMQKGNARSSAALRVQCLGRTKAQTFTNWRRPPRAVTQPVPAHFRFWQKGRPPAKSPTLFVKSARWPCSKCCSSQGLGFIGFRVYRV